MNVTQRIARKLIHPDDGQTGQPRTDEVPMSAHAGLERAANDTPIFRQPAAIRSARKKIERFLAKYVQRSPKIEVRKSPSEAVYLLKADGTWELSPSAGTASDLVNQKPGRLQRDRRRLLDEAQAVNLSNKTKPAGMKSLSSTQPEPPSKSELRHSNVDKGKARELDFVPIGIGMSMSSHTHGVEQLIDLLEASQVGMEAGLSIMLNITINSENWKPAREAFAQSSATLRRMSTSMAGLRDLERMIKLINIDTTSLNMGSLKAMSERAARLYDKSIQRYQEATLGDLKFGELGEPATYSLPVEGQRSLAFSAPVVREIMLAARDLNELLNDLRAEIDALKALARSPKAPPMRPMK
ncbi:hypothetical protein [Noviherbaspirillum malthae]|jgi:hypothetical protein|uniref:hypothetical protein n=1 Tax=Noviherbaspirillum malthae TaxID=1260987 RepID=UPI00188DDB2C|nr:hypothetical protein [Noviherbaspirillum malthae]